MAIWKTYGNLYYPVSGTHDIVISPSWNGLHFNAIYQLVLDPSKVPADVSPVSNIPFCFPSYTIPKTEPMWSFLNSPPGAGYYDPAATFAEQLKPGKGLWTIDSVFPNSKGTSSEVFGWYQLAQTWFGASFEPSGSAPSWPWVEYLNFAGLKGFASPWNEKAFEQLFVQSASLDWFCNNIGTARLAPRRLEWSSTETCYLAVKDPSPSAARTGVWPPLSGGGYAMFTVRQYPMNLMGKKWNPGTSPQSIDATRFGDWGTSLTSRGKTRPWQSSGSIPAQPLRRFRLAGGVKSYTAQTFSGGSPGVLYTVKDVTSEYVLPAGAGSKFPYPLLTMETGYPKVGFKPSNGFEPLVVRISSAPVTVTQLQCLGSPTTLDPKGYFNMNVPVYKYTFAVADVALEADVS